MLPTEPDWSGRAEGAGVGLNSAGASHVGRGIAPPRGHSRPHNALRGASLGAAGPGSTGTGRPLQSSSLAAQGRSYPWRLPMFSLPITACPGQEPNPCHRVEAGMSLGPQSSGGAGMQGPGPHCALGLWAARAAVALRRACPGQLG